MSETDPTHRRVWALLLLVFAISEITLYRLAIPAFQPTGTTFTGSGDPFWFLLLSYAGLYLYYITSIAGVVITGFLLYDFFQSVPSRKGRYAFLLSGSLALSLCAWALLGTISSHLSWVLEAAFLFCLVSLLLIQIKDFQGRRGCQLGMVLLLIPVAIHFYGEFGLLSWVGKEGLWKGFSDRVEAIRYAFVAMAALAAPLCFTHRPLSKSVTHLTPWVVSGFAGLLMLSFKLRDYSFLAELAKEAFGVVLSPSPSAGLAALYIVVCLTVLWTIVSCFSSEFGERIHVGVGLSLVVCGGFSFSWPIQFLCVLAGFIVLAHHGQGQSWIQEMND